MVKDEKPQGEWQRFNARLPQWLYDALKEAAFSNRRPMNDELVYRLVRSFRPDIAEGEEEVVIYDGPLSPVTEERGQLTAKSSARKDVEARLERVERQLDAMVKWILRQRGLEDIASKELRDISDAP